MKSLLFKWMERSAVARQRILQIYFFLKKGRILPREFKKYHYLEYFFNSRKSLKKNIGSLDLNSGISQGYYNGNGYFILTEPGNTIESEILINGCWEPHVLGILETVIRHSSKNIIIDVGANIGAISIPLAISFRDKKFYCIEAHPDIHARLKQNLALNGLDNVHPLQLAASDSDGTLDFYAQVHSENMGLSSTQKNADIKQFNTIKTQCVTLDSLFSAEAGSIAAIKIDTQGSELAVLRGANELIKQSSPVVIFEYEDQYFSTESERAATKLALVDFFTKHNYQLFAINDSEVRFFPKTTFNSAFQGEIIGFPTGCVRLDPAV
jgi:FkbM family methyltransferase